MTDQFGELLTPPSAPRPSGRRLVVQAVSFVLGLALLGWCIARAVEQNRFGELLDASPWQIAGLIGCTVVSVLANGAIFWAAVRPVAPIRMREQQLVNAVVNLLNYAPVRLGLITRVAHHRRVDGLSYSVLLAWYAAVGVVLLTTLGCVLLATLARPQVDAIWALLLFVLLVVGAGALVYAARHRWLHGRWQGASAVLADPGHVALGVALRLIDMAAYGGRLFISLHVLGYTLSLRDAVYLTLLSMLANLSPVGSVGFREFGVAFFGPMLTDPNLTGVVESAVLVDRAAEAVVFIPAGIIAGAWMMRKWRTLPGPSRIGTTDARR